MHNDKLNSVQRTENDGEAIEVTEDQMEEFRVVIKSGSELTERSEFRGKRRDNLFSIVIEDQRDKFSFDKREKHRKGGVEEDNYKVVIKDGD